MCLLQFSTDAKKPLCKAEKQIEEAINTAAAHGPDVDTSSSVDLANLFPSVYFSHLNIFPPPLPPALFFLWSNIDLKPVKVSTSIFNTKNQQP